MLLPVHFHRHRKILVGQAHGSYSHHILLRSPVMDRPAPAADAEKRRKKIGKIQENRLKATQNCVNICIELVYVCISM